jgi:ATP-dependent Clp protease adapter protein ClpS
MMRLTALLVALFCSLQQQTCVVAFVTNFPTTAFLKRATTLIPHAQAQPEVQIKTKVKVETKQKQKVTQKQKVKSGEPVQRHEDDFQDAPMYKVMLLSDDSYDPEHVVTRMCAIMEDMDEDQAVTVYQQAMQSGKAMCGKYPFERAELFKEQLIRSDPMIYR